MNIEIIVTNLLESNLAEKFGANRLELIHSFEHGGLSPNLEITKAVCDTVNIPVNVMLRPQSNLTFVYSKSDTMVLLRELEYIRDHTRANGIVFGALDQNGKIDLNILNLIIRNKGQLKLTFHRAIDVSKNILESYAQLLKIPEVDWVLTSGGFDTAVNGINVIKQMQKLRGGNSNATIIAGSGITPVNARNIIKHTNVSEIHLGTGVRNNNELSQDKFNELILALK